MECTCRTPLQFISSSALSSPAELRCHSPIALRSHTHKRLLGSWVVWVLLSFLPSHYPNDYSLPQMTLWVMGALWSIKALIWILCPRTLNSESIKCCFSFKMHAKSWQELFMHKSNGCPEPVFKPVTNTGRILHKKADPAVQLGVQSSIHSIK